MRANDGADDEFLREMQALGTILIHFHIKIVLIRKLLNSYHTSNSAEFCFSGYHNELLEDKMQQRGRDYDGMLRLGCRRFPQLVPEIIRGIISRHRILVVSAGFAHTMLLSEDGKLFAAGYNDRGQLGLG
jgi:hypothetical protein